MTICIKKSFTFIALAVASLGAYASTTVIGFDDLSTRDNFHYLGISNTYQGFQWSSSGAPDEGWAVATTNHRMWVESLQPVSGNGYAWNWDGVQSLYINFNSSVNVQGAYFANYGSVYSWNSSTIQLFGYDSGNNLVSTSTVLALTDKFQYLSAGANNITKLEIRSDSENTWFAVDSISVAAVPEPETYAMLLAGLGLMGAVARRKQK